MFLQNTFFKKLCRNQTVLCRA